MQTKRVRATLLAITVAVSVAFLGRYYVQRAHAEWLYLRAHPNFSGLWDFGHHITLVPAYVITLFVLKRLVKKFANEVAERIAILAVIFRCI
jgi:asparagine N-glycosylation enzyme membrane subunit Stt3